MHITYENRCGDKSSGRGTTDGRIATGIIKRSNKAINGSGFCLDISNGFAKRKGSIKHTNELRSI